MELKTFDDQFKSNILPHLKTHYVRPEKRSSAFLFVAWLTVIDLGVVARTSSQSLKAVRTELKT